MKNSSILDLDKVKTVDEIVNNKNISVVTLSKNNADVFYYAVNDIVERNGDIKLVVIMKDVEKGIKNFSFLSKISSIKNISILCNDFNNELDSLDFLKEIDCLNVLSISGYIKKNISLGVLINHPNLNKLKLSGFNLESKEQEVINKLNLIDCLHLPNIDLSLFTFKEKLIELNIEKEIKNEGLISNVFPLLKKISFSCCNKLYNFDFINKLELVESVCFNYCKNLTSFPDISKNKNVHEVKVYNSKKFSELSNLAKISGLKKIVLSGNDNLNFDNIKILSKLKELEVFYCKLKAKSDQENFERFAKENGWKVERDKN